MLLSGKIQVRDAAATPNQSIDNIEKEIRMEIETERVSAKINPHSTSLRSSANKRSTCTLFCLMNYSTFAAVVKLWRTIKNYIVSVITGEKKYANDKTRGLFSEYLFV